MRKRQKEKILGFIQTLYQAHDRIKVLHKEGNVVALGELVEQCQQSAIQLGALIENTEGEGCAPVETLELYCEELYHYYIDISSEASGSLKRTYKLLNRRLIAVENSMKHDIQVQIEAVFLPYKASMWDSLESVWQAADADKNCDAYVIPIPYYDRNPDGSLKKEHYEGEQFPEYVPITHYNTYDLEERHPDMIFIHNPYDDRNFVTSIHPSFYSDKLKQYTDCLVYIPYFVLHEVSLEHKSAVDSIKHFCV